MVELELKTNGNLLIKVDETSKNVRRKGKKMKK